MNKIFAAFCAIFLGGLAFADCQTATNTLATNSVTDPIDRLVAHFSATHGLLLNGRFIPVHLSETNSPEQVVEQIFQKTGFYQSGKVTDYKILTTRQVYIDGGRYTAAWIETNIGKKIVLFAAGGQWNRVYEAKPST